MSDGVERRAYERYGSELAGKPLDNEAGHAPVDARWHQWEITYFLDGVAAILRNTVPAHATYDQLAEEMMELHLSLRGKHADTPSMELIEIVTLALNMLYMRPTQEPPRAFEAWFARHGRG